MPAQVWNPCAPIAVTEVQCSSRDSENAPQRLWPRQFGPCGTTEHRRWEPKTAWDGRAEEDEGAAEDQEVGLRLDPNRTVDNIHIGFLVGSVLIRWRKRSRRNVPFGVCEIPAS